MTSEEIAQLFSRTNEYRSIKYDLRNMQVLMERLGNPQHSFKSALIAGTNGKGSVAALLSGMALANSGLGLAHGVAAALGIHARASHGMALQRRRHDSPGAPRGEGSEVPRPGAGRRFQLGRARSDIAFHRKVARADEAGRHRPGDRERTT